MKVCGTGILEMDEHVLHPFVRIHVVDMNTSKYLKKSKPDRPGVANKESANFFSMIKDEANKNYKKTPSKCNTDFLLPMSTKMFDLRISGTNFC